MPCFRKTVALLLLSSAVLCGHSQASDNYDEQRLLLEQLNNTEEFHQYSTLTHYLRRNPEDFTTWNAAIQRTYHLANSAGVSNYCEIPNDTPLTNMIYALFLVERDQTRIQNHLLEQLYFSSIPNISQLSQRRAAYMYFDSDYTKAFANSCKNDDGSYPIRVLRLLSDHCDLVDLKDIQPSLMSGDADIVKTAMDTLRRCADDEASKAFLLSYINDNFPSAGYLEISHIDDKLDTDNFKNFFEKEPLLFAAIAWFTRLEDYDSIEPFYRNSRGDLELLMTVLLLQKKLAFEDAIPRFRQYCNSPLFSKDVSRELTKIGEPPC